ncbi:MAG: chorismate mutase [Sphingomonadaceae bacterium]|nr:chorismate mutase [Sphingomonadaceae bacterium]
MADEPLARWRASIDNIDAALVALLAERFKVTREVGRWKAAEGIEAVDTGRERRQVERLRALATEAGLDPDFLERFLRIIIDEVVAHHRALRGEDFETPPSPL